MANVRKLSVCKEHEDVVVCWVTQTVVSCPVCISEDVDRELRDCISDLDSAERDVERLQESVRQAVSQLKGLANLLEPIEGLPLESSEPISDLISYLEAALED